MAHTATAAVLRTAGDTMRIEPITLADPGAGEVLVRTAVVGVCGTDVHFADGRIPYRRPPSSATKPPAPSKRSAVMCPMSSPSSGSSCATKHSAAGAPTACAGR